MSKVSFTPIQPGDEASVTNPNALMVATNTATSAINQENVRVEGIDERNINFPFMTFKSYSSQDYSVKLGTGALNAWTEIPAGSSFTGGTQAQPTFLQGVPITVTLGSSFSFAVVRYSFVVTIEGNVNNSSHVGRNPMVGFCLFQDGVIIPPTERHVQNAIYGSRGQSGSHLDAARSVESVTLFHPVTVGTGPYKLTLRYYIDTGAQTPPLAPDTHGASPLVDSLADAVKVSSLTASVVYYK